MDAGFRTFDHTGDLGLEAWAPDAERLYAIAAVGLLAQVVEVPAGAEGADLVAVTLDLVGEDPADLLVHWLNTALLEAELRRATWTRSTVARIGPTRLHGTLEGPRRDSTRHVFLREVKAVSHHGATLSLEPGACRCTLVLDI
jgi:SHS2 domain-containing protein